MSDEQDFAFEERLRIARVMLLRFSADELSASLSFEEFDLDNWKVGSMSSVAAGKRIIEVSEILGFIEPWAGSMHKAWDWYCGYKIASLGDLTADELVSKGRYDDVIFYICHIDRGGWS